MEHNGRADIRPIPQRRIAEKVNEYMARRDLPAVERHLLYWQEEARLGHDLRGLLMVRNELIGHYRKTGEREKGQAAAEAALALLGEMEYEDSLSAGTTFVNAGTMYNAFGDNLRALDLFTRAQTLYEASAAVDPSLLGGLYNNMGLTCAALERWEEAFTLYDRAMEQMARVPNGAIEQAITCLNRAEAIEAQAGMETGETRIYDLLEQACALLDQPQLPRDGYYAYVCARCAPAFEHYGWFADAAKLRERAEQIYERT